MQTTVVNIKKEKYDVYIGRPSLFGNPFLIGTHGDRRAVITKYFTYFHKRVLWDHHFLTSVYKLRGLRLGCYCRPLPCHGDVIAGFLSRGFKIVNRFRGQYAFLSNFASAPLVLYGVIYKSAEHAFQAQKSLLHLERDRVREANTPAEAKTFGNVVTLRRDWDKIRDRIMLDTVRAKFNGDQALKKKLLDTYPAMLVEGNNWKDHYWGVCNGVGQNKLGRIIMTVRREIRNAEETD